MQLTADQFTCHHNFNWTEPPADCWPTEAERHAPRIALILSRDGTVVPAWSEEWYADSRMPVAATPDELAKQTLRDEINAMRAELGGPAMVIYPQFRWLAVGAESLISLVPEGSTARQIHRDLDRWYLLVFGCQQLINPKFEECYENIMPNLLYARDCVNDPSWMARVISEATGCTCTSGMRPTGASWTTWTHTPWHLPNCELFSSQRSGLQPSRTPKTL